jgi:PAS domain S-box-containing protein
MTPKTWTEELPVSTQKFMWIGLSIGIIYWVIESWLHAYFFNTGHLVDELMRPGNHEIWKRTLVIGLLIIISAYAQYSINIRRRAEAALHEREQELSLILENNPAGIMLVDSESRKISWANSNALKLTGFPKNTVEGQICHRYICQNDHDNCPVLNHGQSVDHSERTLLTADGGSLPILKSATRVRYNGKEHLLETFFDLSERKKMENDLKLAHAELDQIFQTASVGMRVVDKDFRVLKVNKTLENMTLVDGKEAIGRKCYEVFAGSKCGTDGCPLTLILAGQPRVDGHVLKHRSDATSVPCILTATPFIGPDGQIIGIVESFRDISALKNAQDAIGLERDKLDRILSHLSEGVYIINRDFIIEYENSALNEQIGNAAGQYCYTAFRNATAPCGSCLMQTALKSGEIQQHDFETPDGRYFEQTYTPIKDVDEVPKVVALLRDVTHKKESLAAIMRAEQLAALGELAAGVAHEINNPINGIINYAQIAVNKSEGREIVGDVCGRIIKEGNRIASIVAGLLSFAQSKQKEKTRFKIESVLSDALSLTSVQLRKNHVLLKTEVASGLPEILGHPNEIEQVFVNIISNAIHALKQKYPEPDADKQLRVTAERVDAGGRPGARIAIRDTGDGIPADLIDKVRNPFFSTKTDGKRTGLGLSISHGIVKDHDGQLIIDSVEGEFTCVTVDLPAEPESSIRGGNNE